MLWLAVTLELSEFKIAVVGIMLELGIVPDADFFEQRFDDFKVNSRTFSSFDSSSYPDRAMLFSGALMFNVGIRLRNIAFRI